MTTEQKPVQLGAIGVEFEVTFRDQDGNIVPIDSMTANTLTFRKPSGGSLTATGVFSTDGTDGKLKYVTVDGDLDEHGYWQLQGDITLSGWSGPSDIVEFEVSKNL